MRVGYLAVDHVAAHLRHIAGDYLDMFTALFAEHAPDLELVPHDVIGGEPLPAPDAYDAVLIPGSRHGVDEDTAGWVAALTDFVREADAARTPLVGICFGHQLIAHALGGRVVRATNGWGVGVHEAQVVAHETWMEPELDRFRLLVSHQDQVALLPQGAELLATSHHAPIAAFRRGHVLGLQGHPEFVPGYAEALMAERIERIGPDVVETSRATLEQPTDHGVVARWIRRFLATTDADATRP
ncbi:glutamine amidotransferase-related protein [Nitriliruptor alkaliphilus]|uniref:glutamine amidotransferase-related protein n=1 Tax=Nitriliruptor alkaliphilus TaxID=427918 RepID=UPI0006974599|nr:gamma-glutamyl-gamma-aminobutyrate hydrolase family protein [Nitriliruptor alkaliphilus]